MSPTLFTHCLRVFGGDSRVLIAPPAPSTTVAYESCAIRTINDDSRPNGEKNIVRVSRIKSQSPSKLVFIELLASKPISIYFKMELTPSPNEAVETSLNWNDIQINQIKLPNPKNNFILWSTARITWRNLSNRTPCRPSAQKSVISICFWHRTAHQRESDSKQRFFPPRSRKRTSTGPGKSCVNYIR